MKWNRLTLWLYSPLHRCYPLTKILVTSPWTFWAHSASRLPSFCSKCPSFLLMPGSLVPLNFMDNYNDAHFICIMFDTFWSISHTLSSFDVHINPVGRYYDNILWTWCPERLRDLPKSTWPVGTKIDLEPGVLLCWIILVPGDSPFSPPSVLVGSLGQPLFLPQTHTITRDCLVP